MAIQQLKSLFQEYSNQYETLKQQIDEAKNITESWSKTDSINFLLYEFELIGSKLGKPLKKAPAKMDDIIYYRYSDGRLIYSASYATGYASFEIFFLYKGDKNIAITFASDGVARELRKISLVHLKDEKQYNNEMYSQVQGKENYVESEITYPKDKIFIKERGFTYMGQNKVEINKDFDVTENEDGPLIFMTVNNLASGEKKSYQVYPKPKKN